MFTGRGPSLYFIFDEQNYDLNEIKCIQLNKMVFQMLFNFRTLLVKFIFIKVMVALKNEMVILTRRGLDSSHKLKKHPRV